MFLLHGRDRRWLEPCPDHMIRPKLAVCFVWVFLLPAFCQRDRSGAGEACEVVALALWGPSTHCLDFVVAVSCCTTPCLLGPNEMAMGAALAF